MSDRDKKKAALIEFFKAYLDTPHVRDSDCWHMADMVLKIIDRLEQDAKP